MEQTGKEGSPSSPLGWRFGNGKDDIFTGFLSTGNNLGTLSSKTGVIFDSSLVQPYGGRKITEMIELENFISKLLRKWCGLTSKKDSCLSLRKFVFQAKKL